MSWTVTIHYDRPMVLSGQDPFETGVSRALIENPKDIETIIAGLEQGLKLDTPDGGMWFIPPHRIRSVRLTPGDPWGLSTPSSD